MNVTDADLTQALKRELDELACKFYAGDPVMLFEAILRCYQYRAPIPDWLAQELRGALRRYTNFEARTLDEAFGTKRTAKMKLDAHHRRIKYAWDVYLEVERLSETQPIDEALFEEVAKKLSSPEIKFGKTTISEYYYAVKEIQDKITNGASEPTFPGKPLI